MSDLTPDDEMALIAEMHDRFQSFGPRHYASTRADKIMTLLRLAEEALRQRPVVEAAKAMMTQAAQYTVNAPIVDPQRLRAALDAMDKP